MPQFRSINIEDYKPRAVEHYVECPKFITIARHADKVDDSEFHAIWMGFHEDIESGEMHLICRKRIFIVPKQGISLRDDAILGRFVFVKVIPENSNIKFWLVVNTNTRRGFLLPFRFFGYEDKKLTIEDVFA